MPNKYSSNGVFKSVMRDPYFWAPAAAVGAGAAVSSGAEALGRLMDARKKTKAYKEMLNVHPRLQDRDPKLIGQIYNSLHNVNPTMARDPMVAGAWVDTIVESGGLDPTQSSRALLEAVKDLSGIRSQLATSIQKERSLSRGTGLGAGMERTIMRGVEQAKDIERQMGDVAVLQQQVRDIQQRHQEQKVLDYANQVEKNLRRAAGSQGIEGDRLIQAVAAGAFK